MKTADEKITEGLYGSKLAKAKPRVILCDIDGVVADPVHRLKHIKDGSRDWDAFYAGIPDDPPIPEVIEMLKVMSLKANVLMFTGRSEEYRETTEHWLSHNVGPKKLNWDSCWMRQTGDYRKAHLVKQDMLMKARETYKPFLVLEDTPECVAMYRENGLIVMDMGREEHYVKEHKFVLPEGVHAPLTLMVGSPGTGKTTFLRGLLDKGLIDRGSIVSADNIRTELYPTYREGFPWAEVDNVRVFKAIRGIAKARLAAGLPVILDETHYNASSRRDSVALVGAGTEVEYWVLDRPLYQKIDDRGWRSTELVTDQHHKYQSSLPYALEGDGFPNVTVRDYREVV